jgi:Domain of unknown function (DUF4865)
MLIAQYLHRLPADYDLDTIRRRAAARGPQWDTTPELYFKAFLLREAGQLGAAAASYSSLYLWRNGEALADFALGDRFKVVTGSFGRPAIETRLVLDARRGPATNAHFAFKEELDIPDDADLPAIRAAEVERNRAAATQPGTIAAAVGLDLHAWKVTRVRLSQSEKPAGQGETVYRVLYLAKPLLDRLPLAGADGNPG